MASCTYCHADMGELPACPSCGRPAERIGTQASLAGAKQQVVFDAPPDGPSLELDIVLPGPAGGPASSGPASIGRALSVERATSQAPKPEVDPLEARLIGKFGPAPEHWWQTPAYSLSVQKRLREVEELVRVRREKAETAMNALQAKLDALALRAAAAAANFSRNARAPYIKTLEKLKATEAALGSLDVERATEADAHNKQLAATEGRMAEFEKELQAALSEQRRAGEEVPPAVRQRVEEAKAKVAMANEARDASAQKIENASARAFSPAAKKARQEFQKVATAFALFVIDDTTNFGSDFDGARRDIKRLQAAAKAPQADLILHEAALRMFDEEAVAKGKTVMIGGGVAVAVLLLILVLVLK